MPIGPGRARALDTGGLTVLPFGAWLPDGTGLVVSAFEPGRPRRAFLQPLDGGAPRPITPEGVLPPIPVVVSPDSRFVLARDRGKIARYPIGGGVPLPLDGMRPGESPLRWTADGKAVWIRSGSAERPQI